ncbi:MAG: hypothetical protein OEM59_13565 [Rhodospirillales bacterium]|nr:hypothetical protein [Rhodospirillales bacterium]
MIRLFLITASLIYLLFFLSASLVRADQPSDRLIGLLSLPQLFGNGPCDKYEARALPLFWHEDSTVPIGEVRVDTPWSFPTNGGCEGLKVGVHLSGVEGAVQDLPTKEYGYEEPGAVVLARRGERFKIALQNGAAWIEPLDGAEFHSMQDLVVSGLAYLTKSWDGLICTEPGKPATCKKLDSGTSPEPNTVVLGYREVNGEFWFEIKLPPNETCGEPTPDIPPSRGWVLGHGKDGAPAVWFYSRGC